VDDQISDVVVSESRDAPGAQALARDLCTLAGWFHLLRDGEKRDVALTLAAQLLAETE